MTVLVTTLLIRSDLLFAPLLAICTVFIVNALFRQLFPRLITQSAPDKVILILVPLFGPFYKVLYWMVTPLRKILQLSEKSRRRTLDANAKEEEATEEEIQAYLGVGEEEGIIEEEESELIQSALEFSDTRVREIMTSRIDIVSIEESATVYEVRSLMVSSKFSRIPVCRNKPDEIVGIVYLRNLLAYLDRGREQDLITLLTNKAWFVPETKKVFGLLKEMQLKAEHMAIVIDEYGSVSGLVTMEDVIEEIVGEIRDEDELEKIKLTYEGEGRYFVRGETGVEEFEKALGVNLGELEVTTVSGLVVGHLSKVPVPGETVIFDGLSFEILSSDGKRVKTLRVRKLEKSSSQIDAEDSYEHQSKLPERFLED